MAKKKDGDKSAQNADSNKQDKTENHDDGKLNFDDPEGYVDNITDEELLGDLLMQKPRETDGVESVVVVDGVPQVGPERFEKLSSVINKLFSKVGVIVNEYYPKTEDGTTKGYIFLEYSSPKYALEAVSLLNNHKLDRQHTFLVNLFTDFKKYEEISDEWEPPEPQPYKEQGNLHYYMLEQDAFDQYCVSHGAELKVSIWLNSSPTPELIMERDRWSESHTIWSPLGTYLATFHKQGVALWYGEKFDKLRFSHPGIQFINFSPCEKYLVTCSPVADDHSDKKTSIAWDIRTGQEKRSFPLDTTTTTIWPILRWSHDDRYFAKLGTDILSVYETPSFGLLDKKSIKITGIRDFSWSPSDNVLAYWVAEDKDVPARVSLLEIPSRNEVRAKNLFNVADCKMYWQKTGDYLCVNVNRYMKLTRKEKNEIKYSGMYYNFEIFHMREKQIPVDSVEIKENILQFDWEPVGSKFAIIHGDTNNTSVSFYGVKTGQAPTLLKKFEKRNCNKMYWAPCGQFIVLASDAGSLEFVDTNDFVIMNTTEHFNVSHIEWDPTGRYVVTAVTVWKAKEDNAYWIWSFQGKILSRTPVDMLYCFTWRPRLPTLLTQKQQNEIKKNLKKYSSQFESKDRTRMWKASKELIEKRAKLKEEFAEYRAKCTEQWMQQKDRRMALRNNIDTDELDSDPRNFEEEVVEFFVKEERILLD
ncbi:eukaryotic translation initiation factor 3 subunit B [Schistocerca nitens]|uniref:eukaryotic translation initiation factor 3 subunit B n=1 Tax=Schistocerca nitens TaxID=7011 RepID=UPI0021182AB0|nr:eukaryotic translation initiation factor 3 subunit B [Schistocerca nitens]